MYTPRRTRSTVLGKRSHAVHDLSSSPSTGDDNIKTADADALLTPEATPKSKRARTIVLEDGNNNKENIPPSLLDSPSVGSSRQLRRTSTEVSVTRVTSTPRHRPVASLSSAPSFTSITPSTALAGLAITNPATPPTTPPTILIPLHARARALLRATCNNPSQYSGRVQERKTIHHFFSSFLTESADDDYSALYVSGLPGTGKTALVNDVIRDFDLADGHILFINCMALNGVDALWDRLVEEFDAAGNKPKARGRPKKLKGKEAVEGALMKITSKCVLILDELDHIAQDADSLSAVFSLAQTNPSILRIVGIANTHTLTAVMSEDASAGVKTLHFPAYTAQQLQDIIQLRLSTLTDEDPETTAALKKLLPLPALTLLSKKIATQTGDVRAVFEVLRGAIDKAVVGSKLDETPAVTPAHVLAALKAYAPSSSSRSTTSHALPSLVGTVAPAPVAAAGSSEFVSKVQNLGIQARLALLAIILAFQRLEAGLALGNMPSTSSSTPLTPKSPVKRSASASVVENGGSHIDSAQLHAFYSTILTRDSSDVFTPVSRAEFVDLLGMLDTVGLVALVGSANACITPSKSGRRPFGRSSSFAAGAKGKGGAGARAQGVRLVDGARVDEILRGLGCAPTEAISTTDIAEEEVRALFTRERARITREVNARAVSSGFAEHFAEAIED